MKTKPFNLEEAKAGAPMTICDSPARYVGPCSRRNFPHVLEYERPSADGYIALITVTEQGVSLNDYKAEMIVPEPTYPDWIIQAAKHNQMPWIAQDENLGVWIYRTEPRIWGPGFGNGGRGCFLLTDRADIGCNWKDSLIKVEL